MKNNFRLLPAQAICSLGLLLSTQCIPPPPAMAGTSGFDFRWDTDKDFRKLYYYISSSKASDNSTYYLVLSPKDRNTSILKLAVSVPKEFDSVFDPKKIKLCFMSKGSVMTKTQCQQIIPSAVEVSKDNGSLEVFPNQPVPVGRTIGIQIEVTNPYSPGMYQFNALAQAPGDVPISGYLGSWVIDIGPN